MAIEIKPLTVHLMEIFFRSSRDALQRARSAKSDQILVIETTGLNIFAHRRGETQASLESIVFSFLTIEAAINYLYFREEPTHGAKGLRRWLREKWKRGLSVNDRFVLLLSEYATGNLDDYHPLGKCFSEFTSFRNLIVHAYPEQYHALVEPGSMPDELLVHDVES